MGTFRRKIRLVKKDEINDVAPLPDSVIDSLDSIEKEEPKKPYKEVSLLKKARLWDTTAVVFVGAKGIPLETLMKQYGSFRPDFVLGRRVTTIPEDEISRYRSGAEEFLFLDEQALSNYVQHETIRTKSGEEKTIGYCKFIFEVATTLDTGILLSATPSEAEQLYAYLGKQKRLDVLTVYVDPTAAEVTDKIAARISKKRGYPLNKEEATKLYTKISNAIASEKSTSGFSEKADIVISSIDLDYFKTMTRKIDEMRKERNPLAALNHMMEERASSVLAPSFSSPGIR